MSGQILPGVPESVGRKQVIALVETLGLDVRDLLSLEFRVHAIFAEVYAHDPTRDRTAGGSHRFTADGETPATHRLCIRITEEDAS